MNKFRIICSSFLSLFLGREKPNRVGTLSALEHSSSQQQIFLDNIWGTPDSEKARDRSSTKGRRWLEKRICASGIGHRYLRAKVHSRGDGSTSAKSLATHIPLQAKTASLPTLHSTRNSPPKVFKSKNLNLFWKTVFIMSKITVGKSLLIASHRFLFND